MRYCAIMKPLHPKNLSETYQRYALGLARKDSLDPEKDPRADAQRRSALIDELVRRGIKGWPQRGTFYTGQLPPGCIPCLGGHGSNLCLTTLCTRECFFCFNPKPRANSMSVHGLEISSEEDVPGVLAQRNIRSVGISGGEPLLRADTVLRIVKMLRKRFKNTVRIDLYSNGDLFSRDGLKKLRAAGLSGLRVNLAANGYNVAPLKTALAEFSDVSVEIPIIPSHTKSLEALVHKLERINAPRLILHELFVSAQNIDALRRLGLRAADKTSGKLAWSAVAGSDEAALKLLLYCLDCAPKLSAYYCSTGTQQWIAENALKNESVRADCAQS